MDMNSLCSALIGGFLALLGTMISLKHTSKEKIRDEARQLIPLFYFLNSKCGSLMLIYDDGGYNIPCTPVIVQEDVSDIRSRLGYASRVFSMRELGIIHSFCTELIELESARREILSNGKTEYIVRMYKSIVDDCMDMVHAHDAGSSDAIDITNCGEKLEYYLFDQFENMFEKQKIS